ncbi:MAG: hemoblobin-interacting domain-containing protein [Bacteroidales bacterium]
MKQKLLSLIVIPKRYAFLRLAFMLCVVLVGMSLNKTNATNLINENFQNWTAVAAWPGTTTVYYQTIAIGQVSFNSCGVFPTKAASGTGTTGTIAIRPSTALSTLTFPALSSCGTVEIRTKAYTTSPSTMKLQKSSDGANWTDVATITSYVTATTQIFTINQTTTTYIRFTGLSNATDLHDLIVTDYVQATTITASNYTATGMTLSWINGSLTSRAVFVKESEGTITNPVNGTSYTASSDWSSKGDQLGSSGFYCVYNGTGNSVAMSNLTPNKTYVVQVFEYSGSGATSTYLTTTMPNNPNSISLSSASPTISAASAVTVDAPFDVTFTDDPTWRAAITSITVNGNALAGGYSVNTGNITFTPSGSSLLQSSGTKVITVTATGYSDAAFSQVIGVGVATKLGIKTPLAAPTANGLVLATQPAIYIQDQYGNTTTSTASVTASVGSGTWVLGGTKTFAAISGTVTFTDLTASSGAAVIGASITYTSGSLTSVSSATFDIPAVVEPTAYPTNLTVGTVTSQSVQLTWTNVSGVSGYLIKGSNVSYESITAPVDGVAEIDGTLTKNVTGNYTLSLLPDGITYYFKVFPYNGTGSYINYKTDGSVPQATATTPSTTVYYSKADGLDPRELTSWTINSDGSGSNPTNFTSGEVFVVQAGHNMITVAETAGAWGLYGFNSKIWIKDGGTVTANNTVNMAAGMSTLKIDNGGKFIANFTTLASNSIFRGSEILAPLSTIVLKKVNTPYSEPIYTGVDLPFGNLELDLGSARAEDWTGYTNLCAGNLTITSGDFSLTGTSATFNVAGDIAINGGSLSVPNLTVSSGKVLNIAADKTLTVSNALTNNGTVNLLSSGSGTATILTTGTVSAGTYNVNQALTSYRSWYMSSPVSNATPDGMNRIKYYNEADNTWSTLYDVVNIPYGANSFTAAKGYLVVPDNDDTNILFSGTLNSGNVNVDLTNNSSTNLTKAGFNLVGNPYPSYLDWTAVYAANSSKLASSTMWYRTKSGSYAFWTVNGESGVGSPTTATKNIPPMQAFWVKAAGANQLSFTNAMRVAAPANNKMLKAPARTNVETSILRLQLSNGENTDETVLYFNDNASNELDAYDSPKKSNEDETISEIYTSLENQQIVINGMKSMPLDQEIALGFLAGSATNFSIKANELTGLANNVKVILKDNITLEETDLTDGVSSYNFTLNSSSANRFALIFRTPSVATQLSAVSDVNFQAYSVNAGQIVLQTKKIETETKQVSIYNSVGQCVISQPLSADVTVINAQFKTGMYVVKVNNVIRKVFVK